MSPRHPAGFGNGVCSDASEIFPVYLPAAALSAVPLSAAKQVQRFSGSRAEGGRSQQGFQWATGMPMLDCPLHNTTAPNLTIVLTEESAALPSAAR